MVNDEAQQARLRELGPLIVQTIVDSLNNYPNEKEKLIQGGRKKGKSGAAGQDDEGRQKIKEQKRLAQVNKVKYDDCRILDIHGKHVFNCDEKKALWYIQKGYGNKVGENPLVV